MKISKILIILMLLVSLNYASSYTISGYIQGNGAINFSPCNDFYITFKDTFGINQDEIIDTANIYSSGKGKDYFQTFDQSIDLWAGNVTPHKIGYIFNPPKRTYPILEENHINQNFIAIDTMYPQVKFLEPLFSDTVLVNCKDTIKIKNYDNSGFLIKIKMELFLEDSLIQKDSIIHQTNADTNYIQSIQRFEFIPIKVSSNYKIIIELWDADTNITTDSSFFCVIDTIKPTVILTKPIGGEKWKIGSNQNISWNDSDNVSIISRAIYYTHNNTNWLKIDSTSKDFGIYSWIVPNPPSTQCKIRITVYDQSGNSKTDYSNFFEIVDSTTPDTIPPSISILYPVLNEKIQRNSTYNITWNASDNKSVTAISIYFSLDSIYNRIDSLNSNPKTYSWLIPNINCNTCKIKINVYDSAGNSSTAYSEIFNIQDYIPPTGSITLPEAGNVYLMSNGMFEVKFNGADSENNIMSYKLYLSMDSGNTYDSVYAEAPWAGEQKSKFIWIPKDKASKKCLIKITILDSTGNTGTGYSGLFTIRDDIKPYIGFVEQPDNLEANKTYTIKWGSTDLVGIYKTEIYSSTDTGKTFNLLDSVIPDTMKYLWTIPNIHSNGCFLKLITYDTAKNKAEAISDTFTISLPVNIKNNNKIPKKFGVQILNKSFIICMEKTAPISISIITLNGRAIFYKSEMLSAGYHIIPKNYAQGMYILRVKRSDKTITKKVF